MKITFIIYCNESNSCCLKKEMLRTHDLVKPSHIHMPVHYKCLDIHLFLQFSCVLAVKLKNSLNSDDQQYQQKNKRTTTPLYDSGNLNPPLLITESPMAIQIYVFVDSGHVNNQNLMFSTFWVMRIRVVVYNATFNNISAISWQSVLLVEETGVPRENHRPVASH